MPISVFLCLACVSVIGIAQGARVAPGTRMPLAPRPTMLHFSGNARYSRADISQVNISIVLILEPSVKYY